MREDPQPSECEEHHQGQHRVLRPQRVLTPVEERHGAVVRDRETCDVTDHESTDLHVPDRVRRHDRGVGHEVGRPEEVPAAAERIGHEQDQVLPLDHEEREVVRHEVRGRDRDQREKELRHERSRGVHEPSGDRHREDVGQRDEPDEEHEPRDVDQRDREVDPPARRIGEPGSDGVDPVLPDRRPTESVEARRSEHHRDDGERALHAIRAAEPRERPTDDDPPVPFGERSHAGEERELDREPFAALRPRLPAEDGHACERPVRVEGRRDPERVRVRGIRGRELERDEREQRASRGIPPETFRILEERPSPATSVARAPTPTRPRSRAMATGRARRCRTEPRGAAARARTRRR